MIMLELPGSQLCLPSTIKPLFLKEVFQTHGKSMVEAANDYDSEFVSFAEVRWLPDFGVRSLSHVHSVAFSCS